MLKNCTIRTARVNDENDLYLICLKTAKAGEDASDVYSDPHYPGQLYVIPYTKFEPELAFVLSCANRLYGYCVATSDTRRFEQTLRDHWWPNLQKQYYDRSEEKLFDKKALAQIRHPSIASESLVTNWPAHLHINLLPEAQSNGWGSRLIETVINTLKHKNVPGVHLGVNLQNEKVCDFYQKHGFTHITRSNAIYMGRKL